MKRMTSLALALVMTTALTVPAFAASAPTVDPATTITETNIMPRVSLFTDKAYSENGQWNSSQFTATSSNGNYIRFWHQNDTGEPVKVYLYRIFNGQSLLVSTMEVAKNDQNSQVYYNKNAGSGTYQIVVEPYKSGGLVSGSVAASQYKTRP